MEKRIIGNSEKIHEGTCKTCGKAIYYDKKGSGRIPIYCSKRCRTLRNSIKYKKRKKIGKKYILILNGTKPKLYPLNRWLKENGYMRVEVD